MSVRAVHDGADQGACVAAFVLHSPSTTGSNPTMMPTTCEPLTAERGADRAMGVELMAIETERQLEWAEQQGRLVDALDLARHLADLHATLAEIADRIPAAA